MQRQPLRRPKGEDIYILPIQQPCVLLVRQRVRITDKGQPLIGGFGNDSMMPSNLARGIEHHPTWAPPGPYAANGQHGIIGKDRPDPCEDGIDPAALAMHHPTAGFVGDPSLFTRLADNSAIGRLGPFGDDPRQPGSNSMAEWRADEFRELGSMVEPDINPRIPEGIRATSGILGRVGLGDHNPRDSRANDGIGAWRRLSVVGAGFESDVHRPPASFLSSVLKSIDLRVRTAEALVMAHPDDAAARISNDAPHQRVWFNGSMTAHAKKRGAVEQSGITILTEMLTTRWERT